MVRIAIQPTITRAVTAPAVIFAFWMRVVEWSNASSSSNHIGLAIKPDRRGRKRQGPPVRAPMDMWREPGGLQRAQLRHALGAAGAKKPARPNRRAGNGGSWVSTSGVNVGHRRQVGPSRAGLREPYGDAGDGENS